MEPIVYSKIVFNPARQVSVSALGLSFLPTTLHCFANRVVHISEECVRGIAHFTRALIMQLWPDFLGKQFPQFPEIPRKCFDVS